jgi:uncharacterized protein YutE (UPF0331/DUF86 family)
MKLVENILRFEKHLEGAIRLKDKNISDYLVYNTLAMECFQAVNALIEIGEYIVAKNKLGFPSSYREIFELLEESGFITKNELEDVKRLVFLRNLIAHEYQRISEDELQEMPDLLCKIRPFVDRTKEEGK